MLNKLRNYLIVAILSIGSVQLATAKDINQNDMAFAFDNTAVTNANIGGDFALLSNKEMQDTEGQWGPWGAVAGFGIGAWSYGGYLAGGGDFSWSGALGTIGGSTLAGAWGGPAMSAARYWGASRTGAAFGAGVGRLNSHGW